MKKYLIAASMCALIMGAASCGGPKQETREADNEEFMWVADVFDDIRILRYQVPGFDRLTLDEKMFIYYMSEAAVCGRDIMFDQNCRENLRVRRTLETIYDDYAGVREGEEWTAFETYLKKVWFANGIHHHYSGDKFVPGFSEEYFDELMTVFPQKDQPAAYSGMPEYEKDPLAYIRKVIFDPAVMPMRIDRSKGVDMLLSSAMNYYEGVTQKEAEAFYAAMADPNDPTPPSWGLNSKLVKENGKLVERVWKVGGMYSPAIEKMVEWLEKAAAVANPVQREIVESLIEYYRTGDLREFDRFNILWLADTESNTDFVNGFTEVYGDPLGYKASWESLVNFKDHEATRRTQVISDYAQWFEDNSPIDNRFKKAEVRGVSAKVITAAMLGGDCYPATPIGINLPNADWIRRDHGSKSVTIQNITDAIAEAAKGNGFNVAFVLREADRERLTAWGGLADNLHTDMHECLGHGSGKLAPGVRGDELKNYGSTLEETRADLFALYFMADPKMIETGLIPTLDVAWAEYAKYIMNGCMTQLSRIQPGKNIEQDHMRNRQLIARWCYEHGMIGNVIEEVVENGKTYIVVNDFEKLRELFGVLLREVQRIKSEGDFEAGQKLVEKYAVAVDPVLHAEVLERYGKLNLRPYTGFINPEYLPVMENGEIVDIKIAYPDSYAGQMTHYSRNYSYLPSHN